MSLKILLIDTDSERAEALEKKFSEAGFVDVARAPSGGDLIAAVERLLPDLIIIDMALPDRDALEDLRHLSANAPRPIVMFSDEDDPAFVGEAIAAGVCSYNLSGVANREVKPIVASAIALFQRYRHVESELAAAKAQLDERRLIERAKAALMRGRKMTEPEAYRWLQRKAMNENSKLFLVAAAFVKKEEADARGK
ncbi:response regulator receiver and ANTAR domain protein [Methylocella silvestris BL2]|uniref:Response regulator receiver and ANTAR domain protein n=1 Tax=Methylocella silvestris (strain DSM 15510 / CIP 108128 / LMG 27833 / NCIMB 13906 / BL2) TaxID=395965 RepID=B8EJF8_METSB|nr:ANTAR domain-containing protein [Methylocella silvestris]ACK52650.1 response regulator receiver and ANTAR domain protein [Methylocella silvestris BL2]